MINSECKKLLIEKIQRLAMKVELSKNNMNKDYRNKDEKLGASNIRSVANICENADCYQELKLYIQYKIGKGNGWDKPLNNSLTFGQAVLNDMDEIYNEAGKDDDEAIRRIALYFGYMYWQKVSIEKSNKGSRRK